MLKLIQASFKKTPYFNSRKIIQKIYCLKRVLFSHLSYHQMLHFSWKFYWNSSSLSEDKNFYYFNCNCFSFFWIFFTCYKKIHVSIYKIMSAVFCFEWVSGWFSDTHSTPKVGGELRVQNKVIKGNNICFAFLVKKIFLNFCRLFHFVLI